MATRLEFAYNSGQLCVNVPAEVATRVEKRSPETIAVLHRLAERDLGCIALDAPNIRHSGMQIAMNTPAFSDLEALTRMRASLSLVKCIGQIADVTQKNERSKQLELLGFGIAADAFDLKAIVELAPINLVELTETTREHMVQTASDLRLFETAEHTGEDAAEWLTHAEITHSVLNLRLLGTHSCVTSVEFADYNPTKPVLVMGRDIQPLHEPLVYLHGLVALATGD